MQIKLITVLVLLSGFVLSCRSNMDLADNSESPKIENFHFTQDDNLVTIHYDLIASPENSAFNVQLVLELNNGQFYEIPASSVSGEVGGNISPGTDKKIIWDVLEDFPQGLESDQIQFALNAWQPANNNRRWIYIAAGSLLIGGGISAAIMLNGRNGSSGLPAPPSRPGS